MPSETSLYRKIQMVLDAANTVEVESLVQLREEVKGSGLASFLSRQYDEKTDRFVTAQSSRSIRRTVGFCRTLGLLRSDGTLSAAGTQALAPAKFDRVAIAHIRRFLRANGITQAALNQSIESCLRSDTTVLPTSKELWDAAGDSVSYSLFSRMLTLLAHCGGAQSSQKKIFLRFG